MAVFLAANLGELPTQSTLHEAMALAQRSVVNISERNLQALAWETTFGNEPTIIEKYGGLNNASAYIAHDAQPKTRYHDPGQPRQFKSK
jgi:beta-lactamase class C